MVFPLMVGGYLLTRESDRGNTDEITQRVGFNHPEKYKQIHEGPGTGQLVASVQGWKSGIASDFDEVAQLLDEANAKAGVAWSGQAAEEHGSSLKPMSQFVLDAKDVSTSVGDSAEQQVQNFGQIKNGMPEPVKVDATDNLLEKGGAWLVGSETDLQKQEREATEKAEEAKRHYDNYNQSTQNVSQNLAFYPKAPEMAYEQGSGGYGTNPTVGSVPVGSGIPGGGGTTPGGGGGGITPGGGTGTGHGNDLPGGGSTGTPSGSTSQWTSPTGGGPGVPNLPGTPPGGGPGTGGPGIGLGMMPPGGGAPGTGTGTGAGGGRGLGAGGAGGRGLGGLGGGSGSGGPGAGGRAGAGGLGAGGASGSGAAGAGGAGGRGGAGGMGAGAAGRGRGQEGEEDLEHENKYMVDTDEAWEDLGLPRVAPPVFGE
ncbi:hypothetical protein ABT324_29435 [Saccharopolyspora sp. NPDC000359]|uniref:PPE domain-containing protein n=1 Tax=Saccharopolyspora sp. NPDC000359 TaxID=3154251 RepID=UPI003333DF27